MAILELKTKIQVEKSTKLLDINGKKVNFQSDCIVKCDPKKHFQVAIVNQYELDEGRINFEICKGEFSRRVKYESPENQHMNHYIVFKKMPNTGDDDIEADVIVQLTELQQPEPQMSIIEPEPDSESNVEQISDPSEVEILKEKLYELSRTNEYTKQSSFYRNIAIGCFVILILFVILKK